MKLLTILLFAIISLFLPMFSVAGSMIVMRVPIAVDKVEIGGQFTDAQLKAGIRDAQRWQLSNDGDYHFIIPIYEDPDAMMPVSPVSEDATGDITAPGVSP